MNSSSLAKISATSVGVPVLRSDRRALRFLRAHGYGDAYARAIMFGRHVLAELKYEPSEWDLFFTNWYVAEPYTGIAVPADLPPDNLRQYLEAWALPIITRKIEEKATEAANDALEALTPRAANFVHDSSLLDAEQARVSAVNPRQPGSQLRQSMQLNVSLELYDRLLAMDEKFVGKRHYLGMAFFWAYEYRHYLREASSTQRQLVHDALLRAGLSLTGESPEHLAIIQRYTFRPDSS